MKQGIGEVKFWGQMNKIFALENNSNSYPFFFHFFFFFRRMKMSSVLFGEHSKFAVVIRVTSNYLKVILSDLCGDLHVRKSCTFEFTLQ